MAFKMKGSSFYGHGNQSPNKLRPSYVGGKQVSDFEADEEQRKQERQGYDPDKRVTRTGGSQVKHLKKNLNPDRLDKDMIKEAEIEQAKPENRAAEIKQMELNKANEKKMRKEGKIKDAAPTKAIWPFKKKVKSSGAELIRERKKQTRGKKIKTSNNKLRNAFNKTTKKISNKIQEPGKKGNRPGFD